MPRPTADMDMSLDTYARTCCALLDIPVHPPPPAGSAVAPAAPAAPAPDSPPAIPARRNPFRSAASKNVHLRVPPPTRPPPPPPLQVCDASGCLWKGLATDKAAHIATAHADRPPEPMSDQEGYDFLAAASRSLSGGNAFLASLSGPSAAPTAAAAAGTTVRNQYLPLSPASDDDSGPAPPPPAPVVPKPPRRRAALVQQIISPIAAAAAAAPEPSAPSVAAPKPAPVRNHRPSASKAAVAAAAPVSGAGSGSGRDTRGKHSAADLNAAAERAAGPAAPAPPSDFNADPGVHPCNPEDAETIARLDTTKLSLKLALQAQTMRHVPKYLRAQFIRICRDAAKELVAELDKPSDLQNKQAKVASFEGWMRAVGRGLPRTAKQAHKQERELAEQNEKVKEAISAIEVEMAKVVGGPPVGPDGQPLEQGTPMPAEQAREAMAKLRAGDLSAGNQTIRQQRVKVPSQGNKVVDQMRKKHPKFNRRFKMPELSVDAPKVVVTGEAVKKAVDELRKGPAPGTSGWNAVLLQAVVGDPACLEMVTAIVNELLAGELDPEVAVAVKASRLIPIVKDYVLKDGVYSDVEWRPVACGEVLLKLAAIINFSMVKDALTAILRPVQRGVGVAGGCESAVHSVQAWLELNPGHIALKTDFENAFNTMSRALMLQKLLACKALDRIWRLAHFAYSTPSLLYLFDDGALEAVLLSQEGLRQGCVFGSALFSLAVHDLFVEAIASTGVQGVAICDDLTLVGEPAAVLKAFQWLADNAEARTGLKLRIDKCTFFYPRAEAPAVEVRALQAKEPKLKIICGGHMEMLGSAVGLDAASLAEFVLDKVRAGSKVLERLLHPDITIQAGLLFLQTATSSFNYLFHTLPPHICNRGAVFLREELVAIFEKKLLLPKLPDVLVRKVFLSTRHGGFGLVDPVEVCGVSYVSSVATAVPLLVRMTPTPMDAELQLPQPRPVAVAAAGPDEPAKPRPGDAPALLTFEPIWDKLCAAARAPTPTGSSSSAVLRPSMVQCLDMELSRLANKGVLSAINQHGQTVVVRDVVAFGAAYAKGAPRRLQQLLWRKSQHLEFSELLKVWADDHEQKIRLLSCSNPYAGLWKTTMPTSGPLELDDLAFRVNACMSLGLEPFVYDAAGPPVRCKHRNCAAVDMRQQPFHPLHCISGAKRGRNVEHNHQQVGVERLCHACCVGVHHPKDLTSADGQERPDLLLSFSNAQVIVDIRGVHTTSPSYIALNKNDHHKVSDAAAKNKVDKYTDIARKVSYGTAAYVFETYGGLHQSAVALVDRIINQRPNGPLRRSREAVRFYHLSAMAMSIMRDNAAMVCAAHDRAY